MYVGGYWRADPDYLITLLTVPKMGHAALRTDVPTLNQAVGDYLLNDHKLYCHQDDLYKCLTANSMCAAMNACGVNGICMYEGQCICNKGWSGADCSQKTNLLTSFYSKTATVNGTQQIIYEYREGIYSGERWELTVSSQLPMDLFINSASSQDAFAIEPSAFDHIAAFKRQTYLKLTSEQLPSLSKFAAKVRISGTDHYSNLYMQSQLKVSFVVFAKSGDIKASLSAEEVEAVDGSWINEDTFTSLKGIFTETKARILDL